MRHKCEKCPYESANKSHVNRHNKQVHKQKPDNAHWTKSYTDARADCVKNGGFLPKFSNAEELLAMKMLNGVWIFIFFTSLS